MAYELAGKLNLNTATKSELFLLPFIDETESCTILQLRKKHGKFKDIHILVDVGVLDSSEYDSIKSHLKISGPSQLHIVKKNKEGDRILSNILPPSGVMTGTGAISLLPNKEYYKELRRAIGEARHSIDMAMFIFKITDSPKNRAVKIMNELIAARERGVKVRILLDRSGHDGGITRENERVAEKLRANNIDVSLDTKSKTTHSKIVIIDSRLVFLGSHNLTNSALGRNYELSLMIDNPELAAKLLKYLNGIPRQ